MVSGGGGGGGADVGGGTIAPCIPDTARRSIDSPDRRGVNSTGESMPCRLGNIIYVRFVLVRVELDVNIFVGCKVRELLYARNDYT